MDTRHIARVATAAVVLLTLAATPGCGGKSARSVQSLDSVETGARVRIEGTLSLRGSTPMTTAVLEIDSTEAIGLDAKSPALLTQLKSLAGMRCAVEGDVLPFVDHNLARLSATGYELLPLPDGKVPIIGVVAVEDGQCVVTTGKGTRYWIQGDHVGVLSDYAGARVWVAGDLFDTDSMMRPKKSTALTATAYGVVEEAPAR